MDVSRRSEHSLDPYSHGFPEGLAEGLRLAHFQREDFTPRHRREGRVRAERLGNAWTEDKHVQKTYLNITVTASKSKVEFWLEIA